jgi:hypothetical protein
MDNETRNENNGMNSYHPYSSFSHMMRELKQMIGGEDYLCYADNGEILFYFFFPIQEICENMKKKHPEETGWLFECIADFFQEAFDLGKKQIVLNIP